MREWLVPFCDSWGQLPERMKSEFSKCVWGQGLSDQGWHREQREQPPLGWTPVYQITCCTVRILGNQAHCFPRELSSCVTEFYKNQFQSSLHPFYAIEPILFWSPMIAMLPNSVRYQTTGPHWPFPILAVLSSGIFHLPLWLLSTWPLVYPRLTQTLIHNSKQYHPFLRL